jgi:formate dehydrogenase beta subunit
MDLSFIPPDMGIDITKWNTVVTQHLPLKDAAGKDLKDSMGNALSRTLMTDCEGVFAGGDAEIGPLTVVACVGNAHRAANVIQRYLEEGKTYLSEQEIFDDLLTYLGVYDKDEQVPWLDSAARVHQQEIHGKERAAKGNYGEVELGFSDSKAQAEADRCLRCYRMAMVAL